MGSIKTLSASLVPEHSERAIAWSPDSQAIAFTNWDDYPHLKIQVIFGRNRISDRFFTNNNMYEGSIQDIGWSPNGNYIAAATSDHGLFVWQSRGTDSSNFAFEEHPILELLKLLGIYYGILIVGIFVYNTLLPQKKSSQSKHKATRKATLLSILGNVALFFLIAGLPLLMFYLIFIPFDITEPTIIGLILGLLNLVVILLPSIVIRYILPFFRRNRDTSKAGGLVKQGDIYEQQGHYQLAIENYDCALALAPNKANIYIKRAHVYIKQEEYQWAIEDYNHALAIRNNDSNIYYDRGAAYSAVKEYQKALEDYNRAIELVPDQADVYYQRGMIHLWMNNIPQARKDCNDARILNPQNIDALWKALWIGLGKQRPGQEIVRRIEQVATIDPQNSIAYVCRAVALGLQNKVSDGLREIEIAFQKPTSNYDTYFWKAMLFIYHYSNTCRASEANNMLRQSLDMGLPPALLTPLYWLEKDKPHVFKQLAEPLLQQHKFTPTH